MDYPEPLYPLINLLQEIHADNLHVEHIDGKWHISGIVDSLYEQDLAKREIARLNKTTAEQLVLDLEIEDDSFYAKHTVQQGESLSLIALKYYQDPDKYRQIFHENISDLQSPDHLREGQVIIIPKLDQ